MTQPPIPALKDALAAVQAVRSAYMTSSEQALANLLVALTQEVDNLRRDLLITGGSTSPSALGPVPAQDLQAELEALWSQVNDQQALLDQMSVDPSKRRRRPAVPEPPRQQRSVEYLAEHLPDFGDPLPPQQVQSYLNQPRVRPQDIQLTAEDLERQQPRRPAWMPSETTRQTFITLVGAAVLIFILFLCLASMLGSGGL